MPVPKTGFVFIISQVESHVKSLKETLSVLFFAWAIMPKKAMHVIKVIIIPPEISIFLVSFSLKKVIK